MGFHTGYAGGETSPVIPPRIDDYGVTRIGDRAFFNRARLTSVELPASLAAIGAYAFAGCGNRTSIAMNSGLASIGDSTFQNCGKLTNLTLPSTLTANGYMAFGIISEGDNAKGREKTEVGPVLSMRQVPLHAACRHAYVSEGRRNAFPCRFCRCTATHPLIRR